MFERLMSDLRQKLQSGQFEDCLGASSLEAEDRGDLSKKESAWLAGVMFLAGADTSAGALHVLLLAMTLYPNALRRAHEELDTVIGRDRLPCFQDQKDLPYINAIVKELLRWRPIAPIGAPRRCAQDNWYKGYLIPKGQLFNTNDLNMSKASNCTFTI
ncbi:hypothetical protein EW026_g4630 [Hermanssonia centrifuga]|uniref:Cytochrome P450 n=1 Tax=Hermanssonia centrifuga TaxID=98765 RepID=A0A4S4KHL9_9APHY|nr:hypothetical protein EW026_g4630 [Hermanssonia centrifuga]